MTNYDGILKWYSGKSLEGAKLALAMVTEAESLGYWPSGYSRKTDALLNKMNVARKYLRKDGKWNTELTRYDHPLHNYLHGMMFGTLKCALKGPDPSSDPTVASWVATCAPLAETLTKLDATKPKPTLRFMKTLSALVLGNVGKAMGLDLDTVRSPEIVYDKVTKTNAKGETYWTWVPRIIWPEGTEHDASKFAGASSCHACGHRISNPFNWVPLVADGATGPKSLWVGRDCAESLFGCEFKNTDVALRESVPA